MNLGVRTGEAFRELRRPSKPAAHAAGDGTVRTAPASRSWGARLSALSSAVAGLAGDYGRTPASATSWRLGQNCVVTALDAFLTPGEQALVERGDASLVRQLRSALVEVIGDEYVRAAERALGREVIAHRSEVISASSICLEIFLLGEGRARHGASPSRVDVPNPQRTRA